MFRGQKTTLDVSPYLWPCLCCIWQINYPHELLKNFLSMSPILLWELWDHMCM